MSHRYPEEGNRPVHWPIGFVYFSILGHFRRMVSTESLEPVSKPIEDWRAR